MKIFVFNLAKHKVIKICVSLLLILTIMLSAVVGISINLYGKNIANVYSSTLPYEKIIIIDAGHGGEDPGAVAENGLLEKDLNLQIAYEMGKALEEKGYIVVYTRTDDRLLYKEEENIKGIRKISDLKNRCKIAERYQDSIFVSVHMNSFGSEKYSGLQVYYSNKNANSRLLADTVQSRVIKDLQTSNTRATKPGKDMYILENINNTAILIECGFLTNKDELKKLSEKEYQKQLSFSIVCGIIEYIETNNA
jgi:N-acetylmuramoyl-L-alanine amidase